MAGKAYVFYGEEFSVREAVEQLRGRLGPQDALSANTTAFDGRQLSCSELEMACNTIPFLADRRLVVVEGLLDRFEELRPRRERAHRGAASGAEDPAGQWSRLPSMLQSMPPTTVLVFQAGKLTPRNPLLALLRPAAEVRQFPPLKGGQLLSWLTERVTRSGGQITPGAARLLATYAAVSLRQLDSEVQKLCLYARSRPIQEEDVRLLVNDTREASIFTLVDALVEGRGTEALRTLRDLMDQGAAAPYIITMLARQLRMMAQAKSLQQHGASQGEMARALGTGSDFVLRKAQEQGRAYSDARLKAFYQRLLEADVAIKTGAASEELALETLVAEAAGL